MEMNMKASVQCGLGGADVLQLREIDKPAPKAGEVLLRGRAAGVAPGLGPRRAAKPYLVRAMGFGFRAPKIPGRGREVAGTVEAVGDNAARFKVGGELCGVADGSFADFVCAREDKLAIKPAKISFEQAAVTAISGVTAL